MKYFLLLSVFFTGICLSSYAQDSIVTSDGQKIKARILEINWKDVKYKAYDDPEFSTYTLLEKEVSSIKTEEGKKYLFNHKLPRAFFGINFDVYQPIGSFGRTDFDKGEPGFAMLGLGGNISAGFYITKRIGLHLRVGASGNRINVKGYQDFYKDESNPTEVIYVNYNVQEKKQSYENWTFRSAVIGPMYSVKLAKWLTLDNRLSFGFMSLKRPGVSILALDTTSLNSAGNYDANYSINGQKSNERTLPTYGGGITLRISPHPRVGFMLSADYSHVAGDIHFKESISKPSTGSSSSTNTGENYLDVQRTYNIDQIKLSVGVAYQFKRKNR